MDAPKAGSATAQEKETGVDLRALVGRLAEEFSADPKTLSRVASVFTEVRDRAPDLFVPAAAALAPALESAAASGGSNVEPVYAALGEWALDAEAEPIGRMRGDCMRFQAAMTRGALRLYAADPERCAETLVALQRLIFLQLALLVSLSAKTQGEGGVVRTLPTPEYAAFMDIFRNTIESHKQEGKQLGLLLIHVSRVEQIDRLLGLQRGEAFMLRVTRRMREGVLRKQDQLGRVSRDQLACLLPRIAGEGVAILAANKILAALETPIPIGDQSFAPDAVIGIAVYPDHGADQQTLVRNGKLAVRAAIGTSERSAVYDASQGENEELKMRHEARLRHALEQGTLDLAFEPQLDLKSGRIGGLECRLRWTDSELGKVPEAQAMETAEAGGLVREVTWWVFNNALRQSDEFSKAGLQIPISLKVTATSLFQPGFQEFVGRALRTWNVPPSRLVIEIDESALTGPLEQVKETLVRLKAHGLRLGVDGFGAGASSLGNLAQLPLDEMKLATEFTGDMKRAGARGKVVRSLIGLARDLGLRVVAEGVGDAETALALTTLGCDRIQGDYVSPALAAQEIVAFAAKLAGLSLRPQA
ncbi:MAG TPA: GGDEF domain-containing phosphodiesterase [Burkholderiales bacterium]|nr:GGDEF domain-containing phosphodiesterase [Burkholderiales bacterium]